MNVSFSHVNYNNAYSFKSTTATKTVAHQPTKKEIADAKTKKALSELFFVGLSVAALYMYGKVIAKKTVKLFQANKMAEKARLAKEILDPILPTAEIVKQCKPQKIMTTV